jgi:hypothetical protein
MAKTINDLQAQIREMEAPAIEALAKAAVDPAVASLIAAFTEAAEGLSDGLPKQAAMNVVASLSLAQTLFPQEQQARAKA